MKRSSQTELITIFLGKMLVKKFYEILIGTFVESPPSIHCTPIFDFLMAVPFLKNPNCIIFVKQKTQVQKVDQ
jgi:hypothetical protein